MSKKIEQQLLSDGANGLTSQLAVELYKALSNLTLLSGEATIPLDSVSAVRKMGKFMKAREKAQKLLDQIESNI